MLKKNQLKKNILTILILCIFFSFVALSFVLNEKNKNNFDKHNITKEKKEIDCDDCNVIIITLTNLMKSHVGSFGYYKNTTPNIDNFNKNAVVFNNAFSTASWTRPAAASLFTSLYPYTHNVDVAGKQIKPLDENIPTLAEILKKNNYKTASFNGGADYVNDVGLNKGFDVYSSTELFYGSLDTTMPEALSWIEKNRDDKFFLFLQAFDLHCPFTPPKPFDNKFDPEYSNDSLDFNTCFNSFTSQKPINIEGINYYKVNPIEVFGQPINPNYIDRENRLISERDIEHLIALYDGEISYADSLLKNFFSKLEELKLYDDSIIIIMSEHGEIIGKKGRLMKGGPIRGTFYDDIINIPLSIYYPSLKEGKKIEGLVNIIDIMPTIFDLLRIDYSNNKLQGKSIISLIKDNQEINKYIFGGSNHQGFFGKYDGLYPEYSSIDFVRTNKWKLIREIAYIDEKQVDIKQINYELYDIENDAQEDNNIANINTDTKKELESKLNTWKKNVSVDSYVDYVNLSKELFDEMRQRGYR